MAEILHHLGYIQPCKSWDKLPINWLAGFLNHQQYVFLFCKSWCVLQIFLGWFFPFFEVQMQLVDTSFFRVRRPRLAATATKNIRKGLAFFIGGGFNQKLPKSSGILGFTPLENEDVPWKMMDGRRSLPFGTWSLFRVDIQSFNGGVEWYAYQFIHWSGQIIATSHGLTPKGSWGRESPLFQRNPTGWWNIIIWPDW